MLTGSLVFLALLALYALGAAKLEYLLVTGPITFAILGFILGTDGVGLIEVRPSSEVMEVITGIALAFLLFSDASSIDVVALKKDASVVLRLLFVGLPLMVVLGGLSAWALLPSLGLGMCALLASILAPTDLSLGLAMFRNPKVPQRVRRELNAESGLNDGVAAPIVVLLIGVTIAEAEVSNRPILYAASELAIGIGVGLLVGLIGGLLMRASAHRGWSSVSSRQFAALTFALLAYGGALALEGNGFIAAFVAGISFGSLNRRLAEEEVAYAEKTGTITTLGVWFFFGASVAPVLLADGLGWRPILYGLLSLAVIRTIVVAIALLGRKMHFSTVMFIGWFGPRGLASVVFLILAARSLEEAGLDEPLLVASAGWTILLSVLLHGVSAGPVARWYGSRAARFEPGSPELEAAVHMGRRHGLARPSRTEPDEVR